MTAAPVTPVIPPSAGPRGLLHPEASAGPQARTGDQSPSELAADSTQTPMPCRSCATRPTVELPECMTRVGLIGWFQV
jgi:hypothetical protein